MWQRAHNILLPNFSTQAMQGYLPMMVDIALQLMQKWERLNPGEAVDVTADMTRLTLDTIALCGFGYRFNSFYRNTQHPFVDAMMRTLEETQARGRLVPALIKLRRKARGSWRQTTTSWSGRPRRSSTSGAGPGTPTSTRTCSAACSPASTRRPG